MAEHLMDIRMIGDRYLAIDFSDDVLIVNLRSGNFFEANASALCVLERSVRRPEETRTPSQVDDAAGIVRALEAEPNPAPLVPPPLKYVPDGSDFILFQGNRAMLLFDTARRQVRAPAGENLTASEANVAMRGIAPKVLSYFGHTLLHASGVILDGGVRAFAGVSTAGKTTTARAFARTLSARIAALDTLPVTIGADAICVARDGETAVLDWVGRCAANITRTGRADVDPGFLERVESAADLALVEIWLLDPTRRAPGPLLLEPVGRARALAALLADSNLGAEDTASWLSHVSRLASIVNRTRTQMATMPFGIDALASQILSYSSISAS